MGNAERQTMWADRGLKWRVLGLQLSDLGNILYRHTLGDEERSCVSPMSVIIMGRDLLMDRFWLMKQTILDGI